MEMIKIPEMGKVEEITLVDWKVKVNDEVTKGMEVAEVETMKSTFSVESPADGVIKDIFAERGDVVKIGQPLASVKPVK